MKLPDEDQIMKIMMLSLTFMCVAAGVGILWAIVWTMTL